MNVRDELLDHGRRTVRDAANRVGVKYSTFANWLNGGTKAGKKLTSKVAEYLKITEGQVPRRIDPALYAQPPKGKAKIVSNEMGAEPSKDSASQMREETHTDFDQAMAWLLSHCSEEQVTRLYADIFRDKKVNRAQKAIITAAILSDQERRERRAVGQN